MPNAKYAFISAYLKGAEAKIVTSEHVNRISGVASLPDIVGAIRDTDVGGYLEGILVKTFADADRGLWQYFSDSLERLEWFKLVPKDVRRVVNAYVVKYDVLNVKAALQGIAASKKVDMIPMGVISTHGLLDEMAAAESIDGVVKVLVDSKLETYAAILRGYSGEGAKSRLITEAKLDGEYYWNLLNLPKRMPDRSLMIRAFSIVIDMVNLQLICRAVIGGIGTEASGAILSGGYMISNRLALDLMSRKLLDIPGAVGSSLYRGIVEEVIAAYNKTESVAVIDEIIEKHKFRLLREMLSPRIMTPLMVVWFLIVKEVEIRNLRLILKAAADNLPLGEIKDYLVFSE
ncbi:MAG: V-type ATPase subunit [Dehalococcoidales bacterium]|nr:V-type ATPase subunit [Dehalococcoidales bacterium]